MNRKLSSMAKTRKKVFSIKTAAQLRLISSPPALQILQALKHVGPASISELGPKIGRKPNSLHYHVRKLVESGMVVKTGTRLSGARSEAVYDAAAEIFIGKDLFKDESLQKLTNESVATLTRLAYRNFSRAAENPSSIKAGGDGRNILAQRFTGRLTNSQMAEVNGCIKRMESIFLDNIGSENGQMCAVTLVMAPLNTITD